MTALTLESNGPSLCRAAAGGENCLRCDIRPISICGALETAELAELEALSARKRFPAKSIIVNQADPADTVYNITGGVARLYRLLPDGRRQIVGFLMPGDFLGIAMDEHFSFSADAVTEVRACRFSRTAFSAFLDAKPHLLRRLHEAAAHELTLAQDHLVLLGRRTAQEKILLFLLDLRRRWARICGAPSVTIALPMSRADIADYLGLTIETVSRTLTRLARQKLIVIVPDGVRFLDLARAERAAAV